MKAVALVRYLPITDPESLVDVTLPDPVPTGQDIVVRVAAVSVNPVDTKQRAASSKVEAQPRVLGWDAAGTVTAVGPRVTLFKRGDEVYYAGDVTRPGSNSELHLVDERIVALKPKTMDFAQAAAIPLTPITAWEAYFDRMKIDPTGGHQGATLLIIGAAGAWARSGSRSRRSQASGSLRRRHVRRRLRGRRSLVPTTSSITRSHCARRSRRSVSSCRLHRELQRYRSILGSDRRSHSSAGLDRADRRQPRAARAGRRAR